MKHSGLVRPIFLTTAVSLACASGIIGCQSKPDEKAAVYSALDSHQLSSVMVSENPEKGVITLSGDVGDADRKAQAETIAKQAAPDYTIANNIRVLPAQMAVLGPASSTPDSDLENSCKASIQANRDLGRQSIECTAKNGILTLKGAVRTAEERKEAEDLARKVTNAQRVVNNIAVGKRGASPSNS